MAGGRISPDTDAHVHAKGFQDIREKSVRKTCKKPVARTKVRKLLFYINKEKKLKTHILKKKKDKEKAKQIADISILLHFVRHFLAHC